MDARAACIWGGVCLPLRVPAPLAVPRPFPQNDAPRALALSADLAALIRQLGADVDRWAELAERA